MIGWSAWGGKGRSGWARPGSGCLSGLWGDTKASTRAPGREPTGAGQVTLAGQDGLESGTAHPLIELMLRAGVVQGEGVPLRGSSGSACDSGCRGAGSAGYASFDCTGRDHVVSAGTLGALQARQREGERARIGQVRDQQPQRPGQIGHWLVAAPVGDEARLGPQRGLEPEALGWGGRVAQERGPPPGRAPGAGRSRQRSGPGSWSR